MEENQECEYVKAERIQENKEMIPKYVKIAKSSGGILTLKVAEKYPLNSTSHLKGYLSQLFE